MTIDRASLLLSTQRALLGAIGCNVLAICVDARNENIKLMAFAETSLSTDEREALEIAATEIISDFPTAGSVDVQIIERVQQPYKGVGTWVFVRLGCTVQ